MILSPKEISPLLSLSVKVAVLVTSISGTSLITTSVGSLVKFPSSSIPSSLASITSAEELPGLLPVTTTVFLKPPESTDAWFTVKDAV